MNLKSFKLSTNTLIIIGTIVFFVFVYIFYLNYYIAGKENSIISTRFRILDQMGNNIDKKVGGYITNSKNRITNFPYDSVNFDSNSKAENLNIIDTLGDINKTLHFVNYVETKTKNDTLKFNKQVQELSGENYIITHSLESRNLLFIIETSYDNLVEGLLRNDVFDDFIIIIRDSTIVFNTMGQDMIMTSPLALKNAMVNMQTSENDKTDKLFSQSEKGKTRLGTIFSGEAFDITISNKPYKAFLKPVDVNSETWYIVGLMEKSRFNATSRSISPWIIVMLSMLLVFIILGLPIVKLNVMSKSEELDTGTIINFAISILLGGSLMILSVFFITKSISRSRDVDIHLKGLSNSVYSSFNTEINSIYTQLQAYDKFDSRFNFTEPDNIFNQKVKKDILNNNTPDIFPEHYPFGDYYFWVNNEGKQAAYMTPFDKYGSLSNLSTRDYVNKKDEWYFPGSDSMKFRIESIVSISSGNVKGALSMPGKICGEPVVAVSARFYSIIDPILPKNFAFCIIDKSGKVWFHSNENLNLKENFIDECDKNSYLSAALYRDISKAINVEYYNDPHRIYIRPIDNLPLYLVTMYDKSEEKSFQSQVLTLTLILMGALFLLIFIQLIALLIIERRFQWTLNKNIIMKLTRPVMHLNDTYAYLFRVNIIIIIVLIPFMFWFQNMYAVLSIFILIVYLFSYMYWEMNNNDSKKEIRIWFVSFNLFLLLILNLSGFYLINPTDFWQILVFQAAIITTLALCHFYLKKIIIGGKRNYIFNYINSLLGLLIIFGIFPTLKFYELAYNNEVEIHAKHVQIDLMNQREERNASHKDYYGRLAISPVVDSIHESRKNLGIYTEFLDNTKFNKTTPRNLNDTNEANYQANYWDTLVCYFRLFYDESVIENKYLVFNSQENTSMNWDQGEDNKLLFDYASLTEDKQNTTIRNKQIESTISPLLFYLPFHWRDYSTLKVIIYNLLFWILVIGLLYTFYHLIRFGIRKIYCLDIIENYSNQGFIERVRHHLIARNSLIITRMSVIDETNDLSKDLIDNYHSIYLDWSNIFVVKQSAELIEEAIYKTKNHPENKKSIGQPLIIIIDHVDWNYDDRDIMLMKMEIIERFIDQEDLLLVLLSQLDTDKIAEHYQKLAEQNSGGKGTKNRIVQLSTNFQGILNKLVIIRQPVNYQRSHKEENEFCKSLPVKPTPEELINEELSATNYLMQLEPAMLDYYERHCKATHSSKPEENIIRRINLLAEKYYTDLLNSCTIEEKYVLYDTADDLIVNSKNEASIINLLEKGLLIKKCEKINFMNVSFRRFVLKSLSREDIADFEGKMGKEAGSWKGYKITFIIIIIALFVFIAIANQDFVDNLNQLFVALGGGIAVITGVLGLLSRKSQNNSE